MSDLPFLDAPPFAGFVEPPRDPALVAAETALAEAIAAHAGPLLAAFRAQRAALLSDERLSTAVRHTISRLEALAREFPAPPAPATVAELAAAKARAVRAEAQSRVEAVLAAWVVAAKLPPGDYAANALASVSTGLAITHILTTAALAPVEERPALALSPRQEAARLALAMAQAATDAVRQAEAAALVQLEALAAAGDAEAIAGFAPDWSAAIG